MECTECEDSRASLNRRMDLWLKLTCEGFNGRVLPILSKRILAERRFNVIELCRKSDVKVYSMGVHCNRWPNVSLAKKNTQGVYFVVTRLCDECRKGCIH